MLITTQTIRFYFTRSSTQAYLRTTLGALYHVTRLFTSLRPKHGLNNCHGFLPLMLYFFKSQFCGGAVLPIPRGELPCSSFGCSSCFAVVRLSECHAQLLNAPRGDPRLWLVSRSSLFWMAIYPCCH